MMHAMLVQLTSPITKMMTGMPGVRMATRATPSRSTGKASITSVKRTISAPMRPP